MDYHLSTNISTSCHTCEREILILLLEIQIIDDLEIQIIDHHQTKQITSKKNTQWFHLAAIEFVEV